MRSVTLYSKPDCHLCMDALEVLLRVQVDVPFALSELDITTDEMLHRAYFDRIPVVEIDGEQLFELFLDEDAFKEALTTIA